MWIGKKKSGLKSQWWTKFNKFRKKTNPDKRAIHIHGGMEHNLARYAKYYLCGNREISRISELTREIDHSIRDFSRHW
jgi:hypothetical protein